MLSSAAACTGLSQSSSPGAGATLPPLCPLIILQQHFQTTQRTMTSATITPKPIAIPMYSDDLSDGGRSSPAPPSSPPPPGDAVPGAPSELVSFDDVVALSPLNVVEASVVVCAADAVTSADDAGRVVTCGGCSDWTESFACRVARKASVVIAAVGDS